MPTKQELGEAYALAETAMNALAALGDKLANNNQLEESFELNNAMEAISKVKSNLARQINNRPTV
jgi:hypothetical protein